jgi:hypothetical protein
LVRTTIRGALLGFEAESLSPSPIASFADLTFVGHVGGDDGYSSVSVGKDLRSGQTLGIAQLDFKRAHKEERAEG